MIYLLLRYISIIFLSVYNRLSVTGSKNLEESKQYIFIANHFSFFDLFIMIAAINKPAIIPIKSDFFNGFPMRNFLLLINGIPVKNNRISSKSINSIIHEVKNGKSLFIAPEGRISKDGNLQEFRDGASLIAFKTGIPVIPVAIFNASKVLPPGSILPRPYRIRVKIGNPVAANFSVTNRKRIREYTEIIRNSLYLLLEKEYPNK
ncbi:MAG: hypothetical protein DRP57_09115 [Spirochaetes bacterium]|nr:MAG: hypothetical protein DRP57_09115 [Spirochaetota bacterium]